MEDQDENLALPRRGALQYQQKSAPMNLLEPD